MNYFSCSHCALIFGDEAALDRHLLNSHKVAGAAVRTDGNPKPLAFEIDPARSLNLPDDATARNEIPMADGLLDYFPAALAAVAALSKIGNDQHNPGEPLHWARDKSTDHANKIMRHLTDRGRKDGKGVRHSAYVAWRALANLQIELEEQEGAPRPRNAY